MNWQDYIERNADVMMGKPVLAGTRITVEFVLERLGQGATPEELAPELRRPEDGAYPCRPDIRGHAPAS